MTLDMELPSTRDHRSHGEKIIALTLGVVIFGEYDIVHFVVVDGDDGERKLGLLQRPSVVEQLASHSQCLSTRFRQRLI